MFTADIFTLANGQWTEWKQRPLPVRVRVAEGARRTAHGTQNYILIKLFLDKEEINNLTIL